MADSGTYTPEAIARRLAIAQQLLDSSRTPPIQHWTQGLNELAKGALGGEMFSRGENMEAQNQVAAANAIRAQAGLPPIPSAVPPYRSGIERIADLFSGKSGDTPAIPPTPPMAPVAAPAGPLPSPPPTTVSAVPRVAAALAEPPTPPGVLGNRTGLGGNPLSAPGTIVPSAGTGGEPTPNAAVSDRFAALSATPATNVSAVPPEVKSVRTIPIAPEAPSPAAPGTMPPITRMPASGPPVRTAETANPMGLPPAIKAQIDAATRSPATLPQAQALMTAMMKREGSWRIVTDPAERARIGYADPTDKTPIKINDLTGDVQLVDQRPSTQINQQGMLANETTYSKGKAEDALGLERSADKTMEERSRVQVFRSLVDRLQTGKLAPAQATVGAWADALGIDPSRLGVPKNTAMDAQLMESMSNQMTLGMIGGTGGMPANNFSDADRKFLQTTTPGLSKLQGGNQIILEMKERALDRHLEKVSMWDGYRAAGRKFEDFERDWRAKVSKEPLFADIPAKIKALGGAPAAATPATKAAPANDGWSVRKVE